MLIYLAGPDIFFPDASDAGRRKQAMCAEYGFQGLYPADAAIPPGLSPQDEAMAIFCADRDMMMRAHAIVANLTPFRGPSADPGTVFELAWMIARGKPAFGYTTEPRTLRQRTTPDGASIEDFGLSDNLMIDCALRDAGTPLVTPQMAGAGPLDGFRLCLAAAAERLRPAL